MIAAQKTHDLGTDLLKLIMSFLIVGLHTSFLYDINKSWGYVFVEGLARIGVPVFLVITGFYLNNYDGGG